MICMVGINGIMLFVLMERSIARTYINGRFVDGDSQKQIIDNLIQNNTSILNIGRLQQHK